MTDTFPSGLMYQAMNPARRSILIIDDSAEDRYTLRRFLERCSDLVEYEFLEASKGKDALRLCELHMPDCILLDYRLPDMDGLQVLRELRGTLDVTPPVIVLTGQGDERTAVNAMKSGAADYLVKNEITQKTLHDTIEEALNRLPGTGVTRETPTATRKSIPRLVADRYLLESQGRHGGMGTVFAARDVNTGDRVALKVLRQSHENALKRFAREARVLALLDHPAIVRYIDHGSTPDGDIYLVMPWFEGRDLGAYLREHQTLAADQAIMVGVRTCDALASAHDQGLIHRDIKPSNLFLPYDKVADTVLLDFGIVHDREASNYLTRTGTTMGTPGYMAPEQVLHKDGLDGRADLFSLGCVLYQCLTGERYFTGLHMMSVLVQLADSQYDARARLYEQEIPEQLADIIYQLLARDRDDRPATAGEVSRRLAALA